MGFNASKILHMDSKSSMGFSSSKKYNFRYNNEPYADKSEFSNLGSEMIKSEKKGGHFGTRNSIDGVVGQLGSYSLFPSLEKLPSMNFNN